MVHVSNVYACPLDKMNEIDFNISDNSTSNQHVNDPMRSGIQALNLGDSQNALFWLEQSKSIYGDSYIANYFMSIALMRMNRMDEAISLLKPLAASLTSNPTVKQLAEKANRILIGISRPDIHFEPSKQVNNYYGSSLLTPTTLAHIATSYEIWNELLSFHQLLATDEYIEYVDNFYRQSIKRFGRYWYYLDISNILYASSKFCNPKDIRDWGQEGAFCLCCSAGCPTVDIYAFDMWHPIRRNAKPGPDFVQSELIRHGHQGKITFVNGDSHQTLPEFFKQNPELMFDLITVDGDHRKKAPWQTCKWLSPICLQEEYWFR
jgi:tetratricopeptide (TPR) repeat protein